MLIDFNPKELHWYHFIVSLDRRNGSCNNLDDPYGKMYLSNKTENVNVNCIKYDSNKWSKNISKTYFMGL